MDWIFENFQILALVLIAFASWIKSRLDAKLEKEQESEQTHPEEEIFGPDASWEQPLEPAEPPPPPFWTVPPPIPTPAAAFEAAQEAEAALKHQQDLAERLRKIRETKATTSGGAAATRVRVAAEKNPAVKPGVSTSTLRRRLRDKAELRRAFVMKEILAPPISQR